MEVFANLPAGTVTSGGADAPAAGTVESLTVTATVAFPVASSSATPPAAFYFVDTSAPSEVMQATACPGGTGTGQSWTVTRGADGTTPVTHSVPFAITQVIAKGTLGGFLQASDPYQPWQFTPESYGAKGDGKVSGTGSGPASSPAFSDPNAAFTPGDAGKYILISSGQSSGLSLLTTIASVTDATHIVLAANLTATCADVSYVYGTDDTAAINAAVTAAGTWALANNRKAQVIFGPEIYCLASGPTQAGNGTGVTFNSQVPLPYPAVNGSTEKLVIELLGTGNCGEAQYWESVVPNMQGTALMSMIFGTGQPDGVHGQQSVVGGPTGGAGFTGGFANTKVHVDGITIWCPVIAQQYAWDFRYIGGFSIGSAGAQAFATVLGGSAIPLPNLPALGSFQSSPARGLATPVTGNNAECVIGSFVVEGFPWGASLTECCSVQRLLAVYTSIGVEATTLGGLSGTGHALVIGLCQVSQSNAAIHSSGAGRLTIYVNLDVEGIGTADIQDAGAELYGVVRWSNTDARTAPLIPAGNAGNLQVINDMLQAGAWSSAPSVPASGTAQQNTAWRDATVYLTSGGAAVTAVQVDSTVTGLTLGTSGTVAVRVPSGHSITPTYASTAPTWVWVLD